MALAAASQMQVIDYLQERINLEIECRARHGDLPAFQEFGVQFADHADGGLIEDDLCGTAFEE